MLERTASELCRPTDFADLDEPAVRSIAARMTVGCATDGNHGRSVAAGAQMVGARSAIFVHEGVTDQRVAAIAKFGAQIIRVAGTYDDAVAEAARACAEKNWTVVSDTSWPGYDRVPRLVMQGYTVMVDEILCAAPSPADARFHTGGGRRVGGGSCGSPASEARPAPAQIHRRRTEAGRLLAGKRASRA